MSRTDLVLFVAANTVNLLVAGVFLARARGLTGVEWWLGIALVAVAVPATAGVLKNLLERRPWWSILLPLPLILFCIVELAFDYVLKLEFRNTALLWPYLVIFYLGSLGMIGYSFAAAGRLGFVTLATYFVGLFAMWFAHTR